MHQPDGKILVFGVSRAGKSYLASALKEEGLTAIDLEKETTGIFNWYNDKTNLKSDTDCLRDGNWYKENHYLINLTELDNFLDKQEDCIVFAHAWNILDCLSKFNKSFFLYVPPEELERRMKLKRKDHKKEVTDAEVEFMKKRHIQRLEDAKRLNIPIIDSTLSFQQIYREITR